MVSYCIASYTISYHISYIISYLILSYNIISYHIWYHTISHISYHIISHHIYHIMSYHIKYHINTGQTQKTNIEALSEIRSHDPNNEAASDPHHRLRGHRDRRMTPLSLYTTIEWTWVVNFTSRPFYPLERTAVHIA